ADNIAVICNSVNEANEFLNKFQTKCEESGMKLNLSKCEWIEITEDEKVSNTTENDVNRISGELHKCTYCNASFPTQNSRQQHQMINCLVKNGLICMKCGRKCKS